MNNPETKASPGRNLFAAGRRTLAAVALGLLVMVAVAAMATVFGITSATQESKPWLGPLVVHSTMLAASLLIIGIITRGRFPVYGFKLPAGWFWVSRAGALSVAIGVLGSAVLRILPSQGLPDVPGLSFAQVVLFVWIYASICEEVLARGLVQGFASPLGNRGVSLFGIKLSLPVLTGAGFFALIHVPALGPGIHPLTLVVFLLFVATAGSVAGWFRERTGSLLPAIGVHALFNITGSLVETVADTIA